MHRTPKYVQVYNQLLLMIKQSQFPPGSKLPSEGKLTKDFNVSRVTLRTALSLLKEDGVISSIHGQGHFVVPAEEKTGVQGLGVLRCPVFDSLTISQDQVTQKDVYYHKNPSSISTDKLFEVEDVSYYTVNVWYKVDQEYVANNFSILLPETIKKFELDLEDEEQVIRFYEEGLYQNIANSRITISISSRSPDSFRRNFPEADKLVLITEDLFAANGKIIVQNKTYIPETYFRTSLIRYKTDYSS